MHIFRRICNFKRKRPKTKNIANPGVPKCPKCHSAEKVEEIDEGTYKRSHICGDCGRIF